MFKLNNKYLILFFIIVLGIILRFYRLLDFPVQLNHDEVSQLYDAISIAQTQKDIYGNFLPTIFPSVQDYKPPFYTYVTSLIFLILGGGELTIKLPGAIFGSLIILAVYLFVLKLFKNWQIAIVASFFTAIAPFEIFFSRKSFENVAGIFFMLLGFACLLTYINKKTTTKFLFIAPFLLGIAMYTYFSHAILIPFLLLVFILIYRKHFLENYKQALLALILLILFLVPISIIIITNADARYRSQTVFITQDINLGKNIEFSKSNNPLSILLTKNKAILDFSFNRFLEQFDVNYIFGNGLEFTNQGPLGIGLLLLVQLPFLILGIIYLIKSRDFSREKIFILGWILLGMSPSGLTFEPHSFHRSIMVFTMLNIISAVGLFSLLRLLNNLSKEYIRAKIIFLVTLALAFVVNYLFFYHMYFVNFPFEKSQDLHYPFKQVAQFVWQYHADVDQIVFDPLFGETAPVIGTAAHYYLAYYGNYPPAKFQKEYKVGDKPREVIFDKFSIRQVYWPVDKDLKNTLVIVSPWSVPEQDIDKNKIIKRFYFYDGTLAFYALKL